MVWFFAMRGDRNYCAPAINVVLRQLEEYLKDADLPRLYSVN